MTPVRQMVKARIGSEGPTQKARQGWLGRRVQSSQQQCALHDKFMVRQLTLLMATLDSTSLLWPHGFPHGAQVGDPGRGHKGAIITQCF